jgi:hypothetical protein
VNEAWDAENKHGGKTPPGLQNQPVRKSVAQKNLGLGPKPSETPAAQVPSWGIWNGGALLCGRRPKPSLAAIEPGGSRKSVHEEIKQRPKNQDRRRKSDRENLAAEKESGQAVHLLHETENELLNGRTGGASQPRGNGDRNEKER